LFFNIIFFNSPLDSDIDLTNVITMVAMTTIVAVALSQLAITASARDCKTHQLYCGFTLKRGGSSTTISH
jgi:hypothetical protein